MEEIRQIVKGGLKAKDFLSILYLFKMCVLLLEASIDCSEVLDGHPEMLLMCINFEFLVYFEIIILGR